MLFLFIIILSIWFNQIWLINNEAFILAVFLTTFFLLIYFLFGFAIKMYFYSNISNMLNLLKYSNMINIYLDKVLYYNVIVRNIFLKKFLKNKDKMIYILNLINYKINNFLFSNIINFFLILKKNLYKAIKNKKLLIVKKNSLIKWSII